ncbi:hypothetical protein MtrunA17_Chr1g0158801 [Medicago truncatula]|uniref:Uncharacterized protein n=1 Tax=Medicago truncatula TaxID=3880 RepID=A0A396JNM0_MEDTR|nr:hypothetical protein MtrunA17_Chr1g0158801 [Medicago truncatula]
MLDTEESRVLPYIIIYKRLQYSNNSSLKALINRREPDCHQLWRKR